MGTKVRVTVLSLVFALTVVLGFGQTAGAAMTAVSPAVDPVNGYPLWYQDVTGLQLPLCFDALNCFADPVDPTNPDSVALGVGGETFYALAEALIPMPALEIPNPPNPPLIGGQALLVLGVEGAFDGLGLPAVGQQMVFTRARFRIDAPVAGIYTVTHPFGVEQWNVVVPGRRAINSEVGEPHVAGNIGLIGDIGCLAAPCDFSLALAGLNGPFLMWDPAIAPAAPAGFLGSFNTPHEITGSPIGRNIFRVDGPVGSNLGGPGIDFVETNLFNLQGQVLVFGVPQGAMPTFSRDVTGAGSVNIMVPISGATTVDVKGMDTTLPNEPLEGLPLAVADPTMPGVFSLTIPINVGPPVFPVPRMVNITIDRGLPTQGVQMRDLMDMVTVNGATFDPTGATLTVIASSSNQFDNTAMGAPLPVLTVTDPALAAPGNVLGTIDTAVTNTLTLPGVAMPAEVVVTSSYFGTVRAAVTDLGAAGGPGGVPAGGGGGGGGGCFIDGLLN